MVAESRSLPQLASTCTLALTVCPHQPCAGGFVGPYLAGWLWQRTGSWAPALAEMGACLGAAAVMVLALPEAWARGAGLPRTRRSDAGPLKRVRSGQRRGGYLLDF